MKKITIVLTILAVCLFGISSCSDQFGNQPVMPPGSYDEPTQQDTSFVVALKSGISPLVIASNLLADSVNILTVSKIPAGLDSIAFLSYTLQMSDNSAFYMYKIIPCLFNGTAGSDVNVKYKVLNDSLLAYQKGGLQRTVYLRMVACISATGGLLVAHSSDVSTLDVTPLSPLTDLFIVGDVWAGFPAWDAGNYKSIMFRNSSDATDPVFTYTTNFSNSGYGFKILVALNDWTTAWSVDPNTNDNNNLVQMNNGNNITVPASGYQTMNFNGLTGALSFTLYDTSTAPSYAQISLIGDFNSWGGDADLTQTIYDPHIWEIDNVIITDDGGIKFRANHDWTTSWGNSTFPYGVGSSNNGPNIPITAGTYYVKFNDLTQYYVFYKEQ